MAPPRGENRIFSKEKETTLQGEESMQMKKKFILKYLRGSEKPEVGSWTGFRHET